MALKKGLTEGGREEDVVSQVIQREIVLEYCCFVCVEEAVNVWRGCLRNGESVGRTHCKDYLLGYRW